MYSIFEMCEPRSDVLEGELREEIFAARLRDVMDQRADPVYRDADIFFDNTYPTEGLQLLLTEALGRLTGLSPSNNAIIRLETAFGGGKTHNLIALYHAAQGFDVPFLPPDLIPEPSAIRIAGVVGSDLDPANGTDHGDATTFSLWGEIAYQLGGYQHMAHSDQTLNAPGTDALEKIIGDRPTLILIDEVARHLRVAKSVPTPNGKSDLAEQTVAFLMSLLEFVASKQQVVVVFTLADSSDAFGAETEELAQELAEAKRISARQERVITPTSETEIAAIVTHRLFRTIDPQAARAAAEGYADYYRWCFDQNSDIPQRALRAEYIAEIEADYPFHPELLTTLNRKTSTIPNFQKTRGALRLLAMTVRELWRRQPSDVYLIHPHHINLTFEEIANDLTSRLERPRFKQVIEADIVSPLEGSEAHAEELDQAYGVPYHTRVATAAFLHSLTQGGASGVDPTDLTLAVVAPDDDPALVLRAAEHLLDKGWFFEYDGHRYRFKTEPSLNKIIQDEMTMVGQVVAKSELERRMQQVWKKGFFKPEYFPSEPGQISDDAKEPKLVVVHFDAAVATVDDPIPPDLVRHLFVYAGAQGTYRVYKNNLFFLVADWNQVGRMVEQAQRYLAIQRIISDGDRMAEFFDEQRRKLKSLAEAEELNVRIAITRAYRWLYYPSAEASQAHDYLAREQLPAQDQGKVDLDQSKVVLDVLRGLEKVIIQESALLAAQFVRSKAWDKAQTHLTTEELRQMFAKKMNLRMLLDINQLKKTIRNGIEQGIWVYYDAREQLGYNQQSPVVSVQIDDDTILYTPEEYAKRGLPIKGVTATPEPDPMSALGLHLPPLEVTPSETAFRLQGTGAPGQALQRIRDLCADNQVSHLRQLTISLQGNDQTGATEVRSVGLAIPQLGKADFWIIQRLAAEFGDEELIVDFKGSWDRYKRLKQVTDTFVQEADRLRAQTIIRMDFPSGLNVNEAQFQTMIGVFSQLGFGHMDVSAEPFQE